MKHLIVLLAILGLFSGQVLAQTKSEYKRFCNINSVFVKDASFPHFYQLSYEASARLNYDKFEEIFGYKIPLRTNREVEIPDELLSFKKKWKKKRKNEETGTCIVKKGTLNLETFGHKNIEFKGYTLGGIIARYALVPFGVLADAMAMGLTLGLHAINVFLFELGATHRVLDLNKDGIRFRKLRKIFGKKDDLASKEKCNDKNIAKYFRMKVQCFETR